jgi:hypothetical protein
VDPSGLQDPGCDIRSNFWAKCYLEGDFEKGDEIVKWQALGCGTGAAVVGAGLAMYYAWPWILEALAVGAATYDLAPEPKLPPEPDFDDKYPGYRPPVRPSVPPNLPPGPLPPMNPDDYPDLFP